MLSTSSFSKPIKFLIALYAAEDESNSSTVTTIPIDGLFIRLGDSVMPKTFNSPSIYSLVFIEECLFRSSFRTSEGDIQMK